MSCSSSMQSESKTALARNQCPAVAAWRVVVRAARGGPRFAMRSGFLLQSKSDPKYYTAGQRDKRKWRNRQPHGVASLGQPELKAVLSMVASSFLITGPERFQLLASTARVVWAKRSKTSVYISFVNRPDREAEDDAFYEWGFARQATGRSRITNTQSRHRSLRTQARSRCRPCANHAGMSSSLGGHGDSPNKLATGNRSCGRTQQGNRQMKRSSSTRGEPVKNRKKQSGQEPQRGRSCRPPDKASLDPSQPQPNANTTVSEPQLSVFTRKTSARFQLFIEPASSALAIPRPKKSFNVTICHYTSQRSSSHHCSVFIVVVPVPKVTFSGSYNFRFQACAASTTDDRTTLGLISYIYIYIYISRPESKTCLASTR